MNEEFRDRLLALRLEVLDVSEESDRSAQPVKLDQSSVGRLSRMDALQGQAMAKATQTRRVETLRGIEAALLRLDNGEYGFCTECDDPINPKRLEIDPIAEMCVSCAEGKS